MAASNWRSGFSADQTVQRVRPEYSDEYLGNPHKGTATFQRFNGDPLYPDLRWNDREGPTCAPPVNKDLSNDRYPPTTLSYCRWLWSVLEPSKGALRFDIIDKALATAARRGQTLQMRTQPFIRDDTPAWYWASGAKADVPNKYGFAGPDHNDPRYLKHWGDHIRALGRRYDGHPGLESFDIAYGGACGEMGGNATPETAARLVDVYVSAFKKTQLLSMCGTPGAVYGSTLTRILGWRGDCLGDLRMEGDGKIPDGQRWNHTYDEYPVKVWEDGNQDAWRKAPVTWETCWTVAEWHKRGWDIDFILDQGLKYHPTVFMPKSVYIPQEWMGRIMAFNKRMGYRFWLMQLMLPLEAVPGRRIDVQAVIDNKGVAPIYRPYRFALRFSQGRQHHVVPLKADIRTWMPDLSVVQEAVTAPAGLRPGVAAVSCGIIDAQGKPVVRFAIKPLDKDGWHPLTHVDVVKPAGKKAARPGRAARSKAC